MYWNCFLLASQFSSLSKIKVLWAETNHPESETFVWNYTQNIKSQDRKEKQVNIATMFCSSKNVCSEKNAESSQMNFCLPHLLFCLSNYLYPYAISSKFWITHKHAHTQTYTYTQWKISICGLHCLWPWTTMSFVWTLTSWSAYIKGISNSWISCKSALSGAN